MGIPPNDSPSREALAPDHSFLFKFVKSVSNGGCRAQVWLPTSTWGKALPVAMMFHGGGWILGSADMVPYNQVRYLLDAGLAVVSFEYRMLPHFNLYDIREDLLDAYRYVQGQITVDLREAGSIHTIDGTQACALGWSAGASNVLWLAQEILRHNASTTDSLPPLRALVPTYALTDFSVQTSSRASFEDFSRQNQGSLGYSAAEAMGKLLAERPSASFTVHPLFIVQRHSAVDPSMITYFEKLAQTDPNVCCASSRPPLRLRVAMTLMMSGCLSGFLMNQDPPFKPSDSPIHFITPDFPPTVIVSAGKDTLIPPSQSHQLHERLEQNGVDSALFEAEGMGHGEAECLSGSDWDPKWWDTAIRPSLNFALERLGVEV